MPWISSMGCQGSRTNCWRRRRRRDPASAAISLLGTEGWLGQQTKHSLFPHFKGHPAVFSLLYTPGDKKKKAQCWFWFFKIFWWFLGWFWHHRFCSLFHLKWVLWTSPMPLQQPGEAVSFGIVSWLWCRELWERLEDVLLPGQCFPGALYKECLFLCLFPSFAPSQGWEVWIARRLTCKYRAWKTTREQNGVFCAVCRVGEWE